MPSENANVAALIAILLGAPMTPETMIPTNFQAHFSDERTLDYLFGLLYVIDEY